MTTVVIANQLVDGTGGPVIAEPTLVIEGGLITDVRSGHREVPEGAELLDYRGHTLFPGMIDAHVHSNLTGDGAEHDDIMRQDEAFLGVTIAHAARTALEAGTTTVRDVGSRDGTVFAAREGFRRGYGDAPRMLVTGPPVTMTGGHMRWFGGEADGVEGVRKAVRDRIGQGADWIKAVGSGGGTPNTFSHLPALNREEVTAIADEAHRLGVKVTMHCLNGEAMKNAVAGGVDGIEHGWFLAGEGKEQEFSSEIADMIAESGIHVTTTLSVGETFLEAMKVQAGTTGLSEAEAADVEGWKITRQRTIEHFARLRTHGVKFIGGTDAGWRFTRFDCMSMEAWLMTEGGMTAIEAIAACTGDSAKFLGIGNKVGGLITGMEADLFAVEGDPLGDLRGLANVGMVMQNGLLKVGGAPGSR